MRTLDVCPWPPLVTVLQESASRAYIFPVFSSTIARCRFTKPTLER